MGKVMVITSGKGGVGKTTITANLGGSFAKIGKKVCLIDADLGLKNLDVVLGLENRIIYTVLDVARGSVGTIDALVRHKTLRNLYLLPASQIATKEMMSSEEMVDIVSQIKNEFDIIIIDSPAGIESGFRNALAPSEMAIVVTNPEFTAVSDADRVLGLLEKSQLKDGDIFLIINKYKDSVAQKRGMLSIKTILDTLVIPLIGIIPDSEEIIIGSNKGVPVTFNSSSEVEKTFNNVCRRILGHKIPIEDDLKLAKPNFWKLFKKMLKS